MTDPIVPRPRGSSRVLIAGSYGHGNCGDEGILGAIIADLRRRDPSLRIEVVAGDVERTRREHGVDAVSWIDWPAILEAVERADRVLQGGGGIFFDYFPLEPAHLLTGAARELTHHASLAYAARLLGKPLMLYACGVGPLRTEDSRRAVAGICAHADRITVRDEESAALLAEIGVPPGRIAVTADPAFDVPFAGPPDVNGLFGDESGRRDRPLVVACPRPWSVNAAEDEWLPKMAAAVGAFVRARDARLVLVPFHASVDDAVVARFAAESGLGDAVRPLPGRLPCSEVAGWIRAADLVVGMRLHSIIFAAAAAVPAVAVAYDPKVRSLARSLGVEECAIDLDALDGLESLLHRTWGDRRQIAERLRRSSARLKALAERNGETAIELLASRNGPPVPGEPPPEVPTAAVSGAAPSRTPVGSPRILFVLPFRTSRSLDATLRARLEGLRDRGIAGAACFLGGSPGERSFPELDFPAQACGLDRLPEALEAFDPDFVDLIDAAEALPVIERARPRTRVLLEVHTDELRGLRPLLDPALGDRVEALIVPSSARKETVAAVSAAALPVFVVPDSLDSEFRDSPETPVAAPPRPVVGWVGDWNDHAANWTDFVDLAVRVAGGADAEFWFVADATSPRAEQEILADMVRRAGPEIRFRWFPRPRREALRAFYTTIARSGGCLVSTSRAESLGMAVLQAMSQRCAVIVPDLRGLRERIESGVNGWTYPAGDVETAARFVDLAIRDATLRKTVGDAARESARAFTPDRSVDALLGILQNDRRIGAPLPATDRDPRVDALRQLVSAAVERIGDLEDELASAREDAGIRTKSLHELEKALSDGSEYVRDLAAERESTVRRLNAAHLRSTERIAELSRDVRDAREENAALAGELRRWKSSRLWALGALFWKAQRFFGRSGRTDRRPSTTDSPDPSRGSGADLFRRG